MKKLLIGGSPCTYWSIAQKNNRETQAEGMGWELFKNYLVAKEKFKPDFFLYENNKSAAQAIKDQIKCELGVDLMYINSALVSAQNRQRFYAFNWEVEQPEDRGILLKDILESGLAEREKSHCLKHQAGNTRDYFKKHHTQVAFQSVVIQEHLRGLKADGSYDRRYEAREDGKSGTLTGTMRQNAVAIPLENVADSEVLQRSLPKLAEKYGYLPEMFNAYNVAKINEKSPTLSTGSMVTSSCATTKFEKVCDCCIFRDTDNCKNCPLKDKNVYEVKDGQITINGMQYPIKLPDGLYIIRKLTVTECCRLQTLPDDYCRAVSNTQAYKGLGNGWTAEVIIHILNGALKDVPKGEEIVVLSMYDGIGTGRYCLDKMGFTNVKYFAYEIDKYAMQVALSNYPDIIELGDAFQLRQDDWCLQNI